MPIATFNRPPSDMSKGIIVVADNEAVARQAVEAMAAKAIGKFEGTGKKLHPLVLVGALEDANAVKRREGFMNVINKYPNIFEKPAEVNTKWNSEVALSGLEAAITADPEIDFIFTSSDFLFPTIQGVLESKGKWKKAGEHGPRYTGRPRRRRRRLQADPRRLRRLDRSPGRLSRGETRTRRHPRGDRQGRSPTERGEARSRLCALSAENYAEKGANTWGCMVLDASK